MTTFGLNFICFLFYRFCTNICKYPKQACVEVVLRLCSETKIIEKRPCYLQDILKNLCKMTPFIKDSPRKVKENICLIIGHLQYNKVNPLTRDGRAIRTLFFYLNCPCNL